MKRYDYLVVGSGLYGAIFAHEAKVKGKSVLVVDKRPNICWKMFIQKNRKASTYICMVHIFSIQTIKRYGTISHSLLNLTDLPIVL